MQPDTTHSGLDSRWPSSEPPPRAFAQGTGLVLQAVGAVLFLTTCCVCSLSGQWETVLSRGEILESQQDDQALNWSAADLIDRPGQAAMMLMAMFMTVGGLAMLAFGLGMQSEKRHSALGAVLTILAADGVLIVAAVGLWAGETHWLARLWHAAMMLTVLLLTPMTIVAYRQMRADPPPEDLYVVPEDFDIDAYKRQVRGTAPPTPQDVAARRKRLEAELDELDREEKNRQEGEATRHGG